MEELLKYREVICKKSKLRESEFEEALKRLKLFVNFEKELSGSFCQKLRKYP